MGLEVDGADPEAFCFESLQEVAADEATGAMDENALHGLQVSGNGTRFVWYGGSSGGSDEYSDHTGVTIGVTMGVT